MFDAVRCATIVELLMVAATGYRAAGFIDAAEVMDERAAFYTALTTQAERINGKKQVGKWT